MKTKIFLTILVIVITMVSKAQTSDSTKTNGNNIEIGTNDLLDSVYIYLDEIKDRLEIIDYYLLQKDHDPAMTEKYILELEAIKNKLEKFIKK
ncbi:MAG: hypothetical protein WCH65_08345 [bacterium]